MYRHTEYNKYKEIIDIYRVGLVHHKNIIKTLQNDNIKCSFTEIISVITLKSVILIRGKKRQTLFL